MNPRNFLLLLAFILVVGMVSAWPAEAAPFELVGPPGAAPGGVSADGTTIVGTFAGHGFIWSEAGGFQNIGGVEAVEVSGDGSKVAGSMMDAGLEKAAIWTEPGGFELLEPVAGAESCDAFFSSSWGMSDDGTVIVGLAWVANCRGHAFRWEEGSGSVDLGSSTPGRDSRANGVSGNGQVVVGWQAMEDGYWQGARWDGTVQTLFWDTDGAADVPAGEAWAANPDGSVVVGSVAADGGAWRWTGGAHVRSIGVMPGYQFHTYALDVSDDGSVIVGTGAFGFSREAFIWTEATGMMKLDDYLVSIGIMDAVGYILGTATGVSADGKIIVGWGYQNDLSLLGWRIDLGQAPAAVEPVSISGNARILLNRPNPFRGSTDIIYSLEHDEQVVLSIHDPLGRQIRVLDGAPGSSGTHTVAWDGRDEAGRRVSTGTYFIRMASGSRSLVRTVTVFR